MIQLSIGVTSFAAEDPGTWEPLFRAARVADRAGVDRLVVSDHVVFGERLEEYGRPEIGGQAGGKQPTGPDGHWLEPLTTLSVLAGMTSRIRLGTNILVAALRRPAVLAKSTATLDVLSAGSGRSTRPPASTSTGADACSTTPSRCSRRSGASRGRRTTRPSCSSRPST
jgi:alkanesulfonate monooxygenase SsuD/methylene tetrahydromethanopterin reductase-like flavin-dependent oxidoreductase (luciferase family)